MAAKYHVELIIGTGELPPLLDFLAKLGNVFRVEIRPVTEAPTAVKRQYNNKKHPLKGRKWGRDKVPGGVRGIILRALSKGETVKYTTLCELVEAAGYTRGATGAPLHRMLQLKEIRRVSSGTYTTVGKEHKNDKEA